MRIERITVDLADEEVVVDRKEGSARYRLGSPAGFAAISEVWLRSGWDVKHVYSFTWLGRPIIQLPEDMIRMQEVIHHVRPDVIIETGVAHGGSLVFYASLCKVLGRGRVIGVDIDIRSHNRAAIEEHELFPLIDLVEGDSVDPSIVASIRGRIKDGEKTLVLLDSNHAKGHVRAELNAYAPLVTPGSYIVAMDGVMEQMVGAPRSHPDWAWNNPREAVRDFVQSHPDFVIEEPPFLFNEGSVTRRVTYWPDGFIRRLK